MESLVGKIIKVNYYNEANGFSFVRVKIDFNDERNERASELLLSNAITVGGTFARKPLEDEEYIFEGEYVESKYGIQLNAKTITQDKPTSKEAIITYLSSDAFPTIGKITAGKIYDALGKDTLKLILEKEDALEGIEGLSDIQKSILYNGIKSKYEDEKNLIAFINMGFTIGMANRILRSIDEKHISKAINDPYYLIGRVEGIGFLRADKIALNMGIKPNSMSRLQACIFYLINENLRNSGNTYIYKDILKENAFRYLNKNNTDVITDDDFDLVIEKLTVQKKIYSETDLSNSGNIRIYDLFIYNCELNLSKCLLNIIKRPMDTSISELVLDEEIKIAKKISHIDYSEEQVKAIKKAILNNITIITGGPGTGKTTIVKGIIQVYKQLHKEAIAQDIALLAPTGRAGKRLNEVTGHNSSTIHSFLGYDGITYQYNSNNKSLCKMVIVDEVSMVDVEIAYRLFSALEEDTKVVLVGDVDQIPSVGPGEVLANLIKTKEIDTIKLDKIHRQAEDSSIIKLAHTINSGIVPENILSKMPDRVFIQAPTNEIAKCINRVIDIGIKKGMDLVRDIQVLIPKYKGTVGIDNINNILQETFNPLKDGENEFKTGLKCFRIGDKVIQQVNRKEDSIMNGDIGFVTNFKYSNNTVSEMEVFFDGKMVSYSLEDLDQINLGYAISIHKSQGSEFKTVIIPLTTEYFIMLKRKLYYTAITRAKEHLILIGDVRALDIASKTRGEDRLTRLYDYIKDGMGENVTEKKLTPFDFMDNINYNNNDYDDYDE